MSDPLLGLPPCPVFSNHQLLVSHGWEDGCSCWDDYVGLSIGKSPTGRHGFAVWRRDGDGYWSFEGSAEEVLRMVEHVTSGAAEQFQMARDIAALDVRDLG